MAAIHHLRRYFVLVPLKQFRIVPCVLTATRVSALTLPIALLIGCAQIPPEAITLNQKISENIAVISKNQFELINAWEKNVHAQIDLKWGEIYKNASDLYNKKPSKVRKTLEHNSSANQNIGELAAAIVEIAKSHISAKAAEMRQNVASHLNTISDANDTITRILASASSVGQSRTLLLKTLNKVLPIKIPEINISTLIQDAAKKSSTAS